MKFSNKDLNEFTDENKLPNNLEELRRQWELEEALRAIMDDDIFPETLEENAIVGINQSST